jgi:hypothetical protein
MRQIRHQKEYNLFNIDTSAWKVIAKSSQEKPKVNLSFWHETNLSLSEMADAPARYATSNRLAW